MTAKLAEKQLKLTLNPPGAPHFGGVWERLVRSCKKAMYNILGNTSLKEDTLRTVLCIVEQLLTIRPLTAVSSDVSDLQPLTPNHFLVSQQIVHWPNAFCSGTTAGFRKLFRDQQDILTDLWKRWMSEYLPTLQHRNKWSKDEIRSHSVGELVWIIDKGNKPFNYPLGRIVSCSKEMMMLPEQQM
ncbi:uncharacterized protein LOC142347931 [Convolutriloba macropyga]|uniref:uncharacterized protein LOC142347931 n=1 Tax=Convolutriloba macropyga TaxID=536237 RepID=UPI003F522A1A